MYIKTSQEKKVSKQKTSPSKIMSSCSHNCSTCNKNFKSESFLNKHLKTKSHENKLFTTSKIFCLCCEKIFSEKNFVKHCETKTHLKNEKSPKYSRDNAKSKSEKLKEERQKKKEEKRQEYEKIKVECANSEPVKQFNESEYPSLKLFYNKNVVEYLNQQRLKCNPKNINNSQDYEFVFNVMKKYLYATFWKLGYYWVFKQHQLTDSIKNDAKEVTETIYTGLKNIMFIYQNKVEIDHEVFKFTIKQHAELLSEIGQFTLDGSTNHLTNFDSRFCYYKIFTCIQDLLGRIYVEYQNVRVQFNTTNLIKQYLNELEIDPNLENVTIELIKKQYKKLALKYHPDKGGDAERMQKLNNAYEELCKHFNST